jgi:tRNA G18 (ribose-2'-O)-methylase SpoU
MTESRQRGYFGIGVEGVTKAQNLGNLVRSAHAFGASFFFTVAPELDVRQVRESDTSKAWENLPFFEYDDTNEFHLPKKCALIAVEFTNDSIELPSFKHPKAAAYILGPEMGNVSPEMMERADHVIKIPMQFCINVGVAGAIVMYDRLISTGRFAPRPVMAGGPTEEFIPKQEGLRLFLRSNRNKQPKKKTD